MDFPSPCRYFSGGFYEAPPSCVNAMSRVNRTSNCVIHDEMRVPLTLGLEAQNSFLAINDRAHPYCHNLAYHSRVSSPLEHPGNDVHDCGSHRTCIINSRLTNKTFLPARKNFPVARFRLKF